ncbi:MAG: alpha/beta hydrolase [Actinobacteria bacterium]|nr:alpha/beta hydrolase [Actinomycetota bacterium]
MTNLDNFNPYNYTLYNYKVKAQKENTDFKFRENKNTDGFLPASLNSKNIKKYILNFKSPHDTGIKKNDNVYCEFFLNTGINNNINKTCDAENGESIASNIRENLIVLLHGFASKQNKLGNYYNFISKLLSKNFDCALLNQPYHLHRTPEGEDSGERLIYFDDIDTLDFYHQAVVDVRRLIDIAIQKFNFKKIILCGFSLGSMVALITAAVDRRINKSILLLGGGNWYEIHWNSLLAHILKGNCIEDGEINKDKCKKFYEDFPSFLEELKNTDISNLNINLSGYKGLKEKTTKMCFLCDPLAFAHRVDPQKILMINSRFDHYFPRSSTIQLWRELGKPKIYWLAKLHTSKILINPKVFDIILNFILS